MEGIQKTRWIFYFLPVMGKFLKFLINMADNYIVSTFLIRGIGTVTGKAHRIFLCN